MTNFERDFSCLMRKGYYLYVESAKNDNIVLEARDPADDSHIIKAIYSADGYQLTYNEETFVNNIAKLLKPTKF